MNEITNTPDLTREEWLGKARTLSEALPYMRKYNGCTFVIKYGGHAMGDEETARLFARDVVLLKQVGMNPIVVHGGGPQINAWLKRLDIKSSFVDGLRVTDQQTVDVVEMVLAGSVNKELVAFINAAGGQAVGLSGKDAKLIQAEKLLRRKRDPGSGAETLVDLGFVGEPKVINGDFLSLFTNSEHLIPVVAPIGVGENGETYNINADTVAGAIASATKAKRLLMLTDVPGVLDKRKALIPAMSTGEARAYMADGTISGGMIPKVETCMQAVEDGVAGAVILDGRVPHALLLEIFTEGGAGTLIERK